MAFLSPPTKQPVRSAGVGPPSSLHERSEQKRPITVLRRSYPQVPRSASAPGAKIVAKSAVYARRPRGTLQLRRCSRHSDGTRPNCRHRPRLPAGASRLRDKTCARDDLRPSHPMANTRSRAAPIAGVWTSSAPAAHSSDPAVSRGSRTRRPRPARANDSGRSLRSSLMRTTRPTGKMHASHQLEVTVVSPAEAEFGTAERWAADRLFGFTQLLESS